MSQARSVQEELDEALGEQPRRYRRYPEYRASEVEWLGEVPKHWEVLKFSRFCTRIEQGWSPNADDRQALDGEWAVTKLSAVRAGKFNDDEHKALPPEALAPAELEVRSGDLLITRANTPDLVGDACVVASTRRRLIFSDLIYRLHIDQRRIASAYLVWLLLSDLGRTQIRGSAQGASLSMVKVSAGRVRTWSAYIPPHAEQSRICEFLTSQTSKIDALITRKERLLELLHEKRSALITRAVTKGLDPNVSMRDSGVEWLGEIPAHWEMVPLRRVMRDFVDYRGKTPEKVTSGVRLVTARNVKNQTITFTESEEFIPEDLYGEWMVRGFPEVGDVVLTTEAPLGEVAQIAEVDVALAQRLILLRANKQRIANEYVKYHFVSLFGRSELQTNATGSTALGIKASHLKTTRILVPPMAEQELIVSHIDRAQAALARLSNHLVQGISHLRELRSALITAAVTGKIDVREEVA